MNNMNEYRESRKKEIMNILMSNPNQSILLLKFLLDEDFKATLETIFEKSIVSRFSIATVTDSFIYEMMTRAYNDWKRDFDLEIKKKSKDDTARRFNNIRRESNIELIAWFDKLISGEETIIPGHPVNKGLLEDIKVKRLKLLDELKKLEVVDE